VTPGYRLLGAQSTGTEQRSGIVKKPTTLELGPNQIVRKVDGHKYFGYKSTQIDEQIKNGTIPKPHKLGLRAVGWFGWQILEWQRQRAEAAK
jgi:predicted DNA-binding transcriptional regulator AlpA